jgi:SWI/SNF-related matrix-associated actin-dependent regulator of chromatin subfamily A containing DEAD/H box 1
MRPFDSVDDLNTKLGQGKKKAGPAGISPRMFEDCTMIFEGYGKVDSILEDCERIGSTLRMAIASWTEAVQGKAKGASVPNDTPINIPIEGDAEDGALSLVSITPPKAQKPKDYLVAQPTLLANDVQLKEYQLLGVNWLQLLYRRKLSCILADEMGMSVCYIHSIAQCKTIQVLARLSKSSASLPISRKREAPVHTLSSCREPRRAY